MRRLRIVAVVGLLVLAAATAFVVTSSNPTGPTVTGTIATVWPTPQQVTARSDGFPLVSVVGVVLDDGTDQAALDVVVAALKDGGVAEVLTGADDPRTAVTVWMSQTAQPLDRLGIRGSAGLPPEGYVVAAGRDGDRGQVVLDGVDPAGQYYAAQTLRQLIQRRPGAVLVPGVVIRDWPSMSHRGSIEGFYGPTWTHAERLDHLDYLAAHKMNNYEYSPKGDLYLRERWRDPFPEERLTEFRELVERAERNHIEFTFALSPGLSICYTSADDVGVLLAKFEALYATGVRSFNIPLDDIDYKAWHCPADAERYASVTGGAGLAQSALLNQVQAWVSSKRDVQRLQTVPTEYFDNGESDYKKALRENLDAKVIVMWTGVGVVPPDITTAEATQAKKVFGHDILIWDNYPVNDYIPGRLPLGPYSGRQRGLSKVLLGVVANPANQPAASKISLFSVADLAWRDATHKPATAWSAALSELAGGDPATAAALAVFADLSTFDGTLHATQAPRLKAAIDDFWFRWREGEQEEALADLRREADAVAAAPSQIRSGVTDPAFAKDATAWLDATEMWGQAMQGAADVLAAVRTDDLAAAMASQRRMDVATDPVAGLRDARTDVAPLVGDKVIDVFLADVAKELTTIG